MEPQKPPSFGIMPSGFGQALRSYIQDALPGGALNPEISPSHVEAFKAALSFTPVAGDAISAYDAYKAALSGNYGEAALNALGVLPFVPGVIGKAPAVAEKTVAKVPLSDMRLSKERSYYGYPDGSSKGMLVYMPPQKFLDLAIQGADVEKRASKMKKFDANKFNEEFLPYLDLSTNKKGLSSVVSHEGRARATRALMDGVEEIPVVLSSRDKRFKSLDEFPGIVQKEKSKSLVSLDDVTPIEVLQKQIK